MQRFTATYTPGAKTQVFRLAANLVYSQINPEMSGRMSVSSNPRKPLAV